MAALGSRQAGSWSGVSKPWTADGGSGSALRRPRASWCAGRPSAGTTARASLGERFVEPDEPSGLSARCALPDDVPDRFGAKRLGQRRPHVEPVARADAAHVFEKLDIASAHQLNDAAIAALAETANDVDRVGLLERDIEEDDRRQPLSSAATASGAVWNFSDSTPMVASVIAISLQMPSSSSTTKAQRRGRLSVDRGERRERDILAAVDRPKQVAQPGNHAAASILRFTIEEASRILPADASFGYTLKYGAPM